MHKSFWMGACSFFMLSGIAQAQEPSSQPASQPASQPSSQPTTDDLAAEFAAELGADSQPSPPTPAPSTPTRFRFLPDISLLGSVAASVFPNGASDPDLRAHDPVDNGFTLQEIELAFTSIVDPFFRTDAFFAVGLDEIETEEAFITTMSTLPLGVRIRAGQFLTKFGRQNTQHLHAWTFNDLPLTSRRMFGGESLRDLGAEFNFRLPTDGLFPRGEFAPPFLTSELTFTVQQGANDVSFGEKDFASGLADVGLISFLYAARLQNFFDISDTSGLTVAFNGAISANDTTAEDAESPNKTLLLGGDLYYRYRPLQGLTYYTVTLEYILRQAQVPGAVAVEDAAYLQLVARVTRSWELALRGDVVGLLASQIDGDPAAILDPEDPAARFLPRKEYRGSVGVSYYTSEFFRLRLQAGIDRSEVLDENGDIQSALFPEVLLQANFVIGAHGAHPY